MTSALKKTEVLQSHEHGGGRLCCLQPCSSTTESCHFVLNLTPNSIHQGYLSRPIDFGCGADCTLVNLADSYRAVNVLGAMRVVRWQAAMFLSNPLCVCPCVCVAARFICMRANRDRNEGGAPVKCVTPRGTVFSKTGSVSQSLVEGGCFPGCLWIFPMRGSSCPAAHSGPRAILGMA
jgi:hypothetical protein